MLAYICLCVAYYLYSTIKCLFGAKNSILMKERVLSVIKICHVLSLTLGQLKEYFCRSRIPFLMFTENMMRYMTVVQRNEYASSTGDIDDLVFVPRTTPIWFFKCSFEFFILLQKIIFYILENKFVKMYNICTPISKLYEIYHVLRLCRWIYKWITRLCERQH